MNIGLVVNARGKMCLVHDESFNAVPQWVGYHLDKRQIEIIFDGGASYPIDWEATDEMDNYLQKINKILLIRMEDKKPVEGYDTSLLHLRRGSPIELEYEKKDEEGNIQLFRTETHLIFAFVNPIDLWSIQELEFDVLLREFYIRQTDGVRKFLFAGKRQVDVVGESHVCLANLLARPELAAAPAGWTEHVRVPLRLAFNG
jgi:hypothetical protein